MYYTYVLKSQFDNEIYIGWTDNLRHRIAQHNCGQVEATKNRRPLKLIYYEACSTREKAILREKQLKSGYGRAYLKRRL
ncbi:excinuclease ABC subunit C [Candidatus Collierbacteria bacterium RIFCSPLOWO2_01_FULL_50_23]|uniref:Excinuclease ABC subunit C n=1 Tax=Candidatus Collierbacteria bacterium RIFCSPHIGHO2_02_FULL_49_10 TaxID=1817723 RepID=A0A1F5ER44_9BACT|nr:MAG: excinuclease ABC subunit C [Candidatus Collierbacteria bacterium RIFCSPHIGHO2_02_FULL_49_10]OGD73740.1 MAG: excinuclease ABC subunit C [Candidatus Collierbacteria bacterium RIFCSPLOWO2_01_FULL_50_23]